jgi:hypothetical protein
MWETTAPSPKPPKYLNPSNGKTSTFPSQKPILNGSVTLHFVIPTEVEGSAVHPHPKNDPQKTPFSTTQAPFSTTQPLLFGE